MAGIITFAIVSILGYFLNPALPLHLEAERPRIILLRRLLAILFFLFSLGLVLDLIFHFENFSVWVFVFGQALTIIFFGLSLIHVSHEYLITLFILAVLGSNQANLIAHPQAFHVIVFWVGLTPLSLTAISKTSKILGWTLVLIVFILVNGALVNQSQGPYSLVIQPTRFVVGGLFFVLATASIASFFSYTQKKTLDNLVDKNFQLGELKEEVERQNDQLKNYNLHLEERVHERTKELEQQNKQLAEYAYINSHLVRGPLARVIGLTHLLLLKPGTGEQKELIENLNVAASELDSVIFSINNALDLQKEFDRKTLTEEAGKIADND
jgi:signal transduction histidine kinase